MSYKHFQTYNFLYLKMFIHSALVYLCPVWPVNQIVHKRYPCCVTSLRQTDELLPEARDGKSPHNMAIKAARGTVTNVNAEAPLRLRTIPVTTGKTAGNRRHQLGERNQVFIKCTSTKASKCIAESDLSQDTWENRKNKKVPTLKPSRPYVLPPVERHLPSPRPQGIWVRKKVQ